MCMSIVELEAALRGLRLSGMCATLQARALQVTTGEMNFIEGLSWLVQDEIDRRRTQLIEKRFKQSRLPERKDLKDFDWNFNPKVPKREILGLTTLKFLNGREDGMFIGEPGTGKSYCAKALGLLAVSQGYSVYYRDAYDLIDEIALARERGDIRDLRDELKTVELLIIDDLFLRALPAGAGEELADILMSRYERHSTIVTSNRPLEDWGKLLGDVVIVAPLLDRLMHHGHLLRFEGKSWRLREAAQRLAIAAAYA